MWKDRVFLDHDFDITFLTWKFDMASNVYPLFSMTQSRPGDNNVTEFANDRVEDLLDRSRRTPDNAERTQIGQQLHAVLWEEMPYTFLWTVDRVAGYRIDRFKKTPSIDPFTFFRSIDEWELK